LDSCPLCGSDAPCKAYRDFVDVNCASCGDFIVTRVAAEDLGADGRLKAELARQTRWITNNGGRAFLGSDTVETARQRIAEPAEPGTAAEELEPSR
jgi:hypothetical protein